MNGRFLPKAVIHSFAIAGLTLLVALGAISWQAFDTGNQLLFPELAKKASVEAEQVRNKINFALDLGIPPEGLRGTDDLFADLRQSDPDIAFIVMQDPGGKTIFAHGITPERIDGVLKATERPSPDRELETGQSLRAGYLVTAQPVEAGTFYLAHDEAALVRPLIDNLFDIGVVILVTLLLAFEVTLLVMTINFTQPARAAMNVLRTVASGRFDKVTGYPGSGALGNFITHLDNEVRKLARRAGTRLDPAREPTVIGVRLLAFLFVFAEELGRSFLPGYVGTYAAQIQQIDLDMAIGVVVGLHMIVVALAMPLASMLYPRFGRVRLYAFGALIASAGLVGTALAGSYWDLLFWRALSALGYATTFVACQGFVLETTNRDNRTQGTAMMVGGITLADICGPAFGGVFAERFGQSTTFLVASGVAVLAALLVSRLMARDISRPRVPQPITLRDFAVAFHNRHLVQQLFLAALPAKFLLTGFLFYLVPVSLLATGRSEGDIGRIIMIYGLVMLVSSPLLARLADRLGHFGLFVAGGGLLSAGLLLLYPLVPIVHLALFTAVAVAALGIGQAMSISPQVSMVVGMSSETNVQRGQAPELVVMRFVERLGGGLGPIIAASLAAVYGNMTAIMLLGLGVMACFAVYLLTLAIGGRTS